MNEQPTSRDADTILCAGAALAEVRVAGPGAIPFIVVPQGYNAKLLEHTLDKPLRKIGTVVMLDAVSYCDYIKHHGREAATTHYADVDYESGVFKMVGVINDHVRGADSDADWRDHVAEFSPKLAIEWGRWMKNNRATMAQSKFAEFIEDNIGDINGSPNGADMLGMALNFEQTSEKRFKRRIDLGTGGVQLEYVDKADDATSAKIKMFERFNIAVPVFQGSGVAYAIECRLKYRQNGDALNFWYELIRPDRVFRQAVTDEIAVIKEKTGFPLLYGKPWVKL